MSGKNEKKRVEPQPVLKMLTTKQYMRRCSGEQLEVFVKDGSVYASAAQAEIQRRARKRAKKGQ